MSVYPRELFRINTEKKYCPVCYSFTMVNELHNSNGYSSLIKNYICLGCGLIILKEDLITKTQIRNSKIKSILK